MTEVDALMKRCSEVSSGMLNKYDIQYWLWFFICFLEEFIAGDLPSSDLHTISNSTGGTEYGATIAQGE